MSAHVFMKEGTFSSYEHACMHAPGDERGRHGGAGVQAKRRECVSHFQRDDGEKGMMRWREEEGALQSCRLGCISSRNCSLGCWGHLTVLSPSTEG